MSDPSFGEAARQLLWSLWTELGVPGVVRAHQNRVIDPEPLILFTPLFSADDPRLEESAFSWCAQHASHVATSRLRGLFDTASPTIQERFTPFSRGLAATANVRWPAKEPGDGRERETRPVSWPLERPALARLRARSLFGTGARADVLCEFLARASDWVRAADLVSLGYSKRSIARVLSDLGDARIAAVRMQGNALVYRLQKVGELTSLLEADGLEWPRWLPNFRILHGLCELEAGASVSEPRRQVLAHQIRERVAPDVRALWLDPLPQTRGNPEAFDEMVQWGRAFVAGLD